MANPTIVAQPTKQIPAMQSNTIQASVSQPIEQPAPPALVTLKPGEDLDELVRRAKGGVLIDFYADWCGPCRTQSSVLHEMEATATRHGASIVKVNVDEHPELAQQMNVSSLPTLMRVRDGKVIERKVGLANSEAVAALLAR